MPADAGFAGDFSEDDTGLGMKYRRTASGCYVDAGGSQTVVDRAIDVRSALEQAIFQQPPFTLPTTMPWKRMPSSTPLAMAT